MDMQYRVVVSPQVERKLIEQEDYLAERATPAVAAAYLDRLLAYIIGSINIR